MIAELVTGALCPDNLCLDDLRCAVRELLDDRGQMQSVLKESEDRNLLLLACVADLKTRLDVSEQDRIEQKLQIQDLKLKIKGLKLSQDQSKHKSEKLTPEKRKELGLDEPQISGLLEKEKKRRKKKGDRQKKKGGGRKSLTGLGLPVYTQVLDVPPEEREGLEYLGTKVTEELGCEPRRLYIRRIEQRMYGRKGISTPMAVAPLPPRVIPRAAVSVSFLVHVIVSKYVDHIPLYRQKLIDERSGVVVERNKRARYVQDVATLLEGVYEQLRILILTGRYIHIDEAFTKVLDPKRRGKARTAFMWGFYGPQVEAVYMKFSQTRDHENILQFFPEDWSGDVHTDGAEMYPCAFEKRPGIVHYECLNHLRRYVLEALECGQKDAAPLLELIGELYDLEAEADAVGLSPEQRGPFRAVFAKPILERLKAEFSALKEREAPAGTPDGATKGPPLLGKLRTAVLYGMRRWDHLVSYADSGNGHICIDQNPIERQWRPQKVGQRNYLFIGHPNAGPSAAIIYSVVSTCRLVGVDPAEYLTWVLPQLAALPKLDPARTAAAEGLLPHDFRALKLAQAETVKVRPPPLNSPCSTRSPMGKARVRKPHHTHNASTLAA